MLGLFCNLLDILFALSSLAKPIVGGKSHKMPIKHRLCLFSSCYYPEVEDPFRPALFKSKIFLSETYNFAQNTVHGGVIVFTIDWNLGYGDFHFKYFFYIHNLRATTKKTAALCFKRKRLEKVIIRQILQK